jgi:hypothetical protein
VFLFGPPEAVPELHPLLTRAYATPSAAPAGPAGSAPAAAYSPGAVAPAGSPVQALPETSQPRGVSLLPPGLRATAPAAAAPIPSAAPSSNSAPPLPSASGPVLVSVAAPSSVATSGVRYAELPAGSQTPPGGPLPTTSYGLLSISDGPNPFIPASSSTIAVPTAAAGYSHADGALPLNVYAEVAPVSAPRTGPVASAPSGSTYAPLHPRAPAALSPAVPSAVSFAPPTQSVYAEVVPRAAVPAVFPAAEQPLWAEAMRAQPSMNTQTLLSFESSLKTLRDTVTSMRFASGALVTW